LKAGKKLGWSALLLLIRNVLKKNSKHSVKKRRRNAMKRSTKPIPEGFHTITPSLVVRNAAAAIDFYKRALGAEERVRMNGPDGQSIMHAELKIGDSIIFLSEESSYSECKSPQTIGGSTTVLNLYVPDVDATFGKAVEAGGKAAMPVSDQFWGDRYGTFVDPFGYTWGVGTHQEDLTKQEVAQRAEAFFASMQQQRKTA
jgi:PhnB protein